MNGHYYSLNSYLKETFGCKVYKLALQGGYTCPNRDGTLDTRGCIFCSAGGSGEFAPPRTLTMKEQLEQAKLRVHNKMKSGKYIAYFQSYTSTYMDARRLDEMLRSVIFDDDICALSLGTRPDCLPDEILRVIEGYAKIKPVWVELGLQTIHERTARCIRRGYTLDVYGRAVSDLHSIGAQVITHIILGLPGETKDDMLLSAHYAGTLSDGIKLQLLHVLRGTDLASEYENGRFETLSREEYIDAVCSCIEVIPENVVIHRLTGDGDKRLLIAPLWSGDKKSVLNALNRELDLRSVVQGSKCGLSVLHK